MIVSCEKTPESLFLLLINIFYCSTNNSSNFSSFVRNVTIVSLIVLIFPVKLF